MRILLEETQALVVDVQEKLFPHIKNNTTLLDNVLKLLKGIQVLDIPYMHNEQYPKGLGKTLPQIQNLLQQEPYEKTTFSSAKEEKTLQKLKSNNKKFIILCGTEAHVCVLQTALDLKESGFIPILVVDCIGSRKEEDKQIAIQRMVQEGIIPTTLESLLFELCIGAKHKNFKQISQLVK